MGIIFSRFRKKKTTIEILEDLDVKIKEIEKYGQTTEQRHKKIVGTLILYSVILYIITAFIFYFYFFPASLYDQIFYIIPLLIFPILILLTKKMVTWYYKRKISENQEQLSTMQTEKKKILDQVTETETYKKAKEILLKFAPEQLRMTPLTPQPSLNTTAPTETPRRSSAAQNVISPSAEGLRRRTITSQIQQQNVQSGMPGSTGVVPVGTAPTQNLQNTPFQSGTRPITTPVMGVRTPLPRPILPSQRTYLDRLIDYIVGDGPSNRYALICRCCGSHNGMALKEEFEYFGFRCCYCNFWNPARKQKPSAPKLEHETTFAHSSSATNSPEHIATSTNLDVSKTPEKESSSPSDTDSDIEVVERPTEASEETEQDVKQVQAGCDEPAGTEAETKEMHSDDGVEKMDVDEPSP